jgi:Na+-transporting NADH:ubiquinone oxidoreductase subunit C
MLRPAQEKNRIAERKRNILMAADLYNPETPLEESFQQIDSWIVELDSGDRITDPSIVDPENFDQQAAASDPAMSSQLPSDQDPAGIGRRENYSSVYVVRDGDRIDQYVLPVYGKGLWSTMYGFLALDADLKTIRGITFYQHGETPGLGGEVDRPSWKKEWVGKKAFDDQGDIRIQVIRGNVDGDSPTAEYEIDGLAGATITCNGVTNLVQFWLGDSGFGPFIQNRKAASS